MDPRSIGMAGGIGSLGAGIAGLFGGGKNPYDTASPYFNKIPAAAGNYLNRYINSSTGPQGAQGQLDEQYRNLVGDPNAMLAKFGAGYQQSPGYQWALNQGQQGITNAAAAGGMAGSAEHQQNAGQLATNMANQDYYNYLNHVMNLYGTGLEGLGDINKLGFSAASGMAGITTQNLANQGALRYASQADQNKARGQGYGDIIGGLGTLAAFGGWI